MERKLKRKSPYSIDKKQKDKYNVKTVGVCVFSTKIRACTGFDGDFEVEEAIRGAGPRSKP